MKDLLERLLGLRIKLITNNGTVLEGILNKDVNSQLFFLFKSSEVICFNLSLVNGIIVNSDYYEDVANLDIDYKDEVQ